MNDLFTYSAPPRSRKNDPNTSHEAGESAASFINAHHQVILDALRDSAEPLAAEQIADVGSLKSMVAVCRRLSECVDRGLIVPTEHRHVNRSGRKAVKYRLVGSTA